MVVDSVALTKKFNYQRACSTSNPREEIHIFMPNDFIKGECLSIVSTRDTEFHIQIHETRPNSWAKEVREIEWDIGLWTS